jgi:DNA-binding XRE family transcriptional regulator
VAKSLADHRFAVSGAHFSDDEMKNCVAELREARGWTKVDLADRPNISRQSIHAIESGKYDPSLPLAVLLASAPLAAADLSPRSWSPQERSELQHREQSPWPASARTLEGRSGYVAATLSPIATHVGIETLRQGGTAADAAVATALMQVTTSLGSIVSYAGVLQLVYYDARTHRISSLDAGWNGYADETSPTTIPHADVTLVDPAHTATAGAYGRETLVPGFMAGVEEIHAHFGRLPLPQLFKPAIWYSAHGVEVTRLLAYYFAERQKSLSRTDAGRRFLGQAGDPLPKVGDVFVQPEVAHLLGEIAAHGSRVMYTGAWASSYVRAVRAEGGLVTAEVPVPQKGYDNSFLAELDKAGIPITQLRAERVLAIKGTAAAGLIDTATGRLRGVEVPGVVVFVETY